jgi:hypothetical protein
LFRVERKDGVAGSVTKLKTSRPLILADGLRTLDGSTFLMAEGGGTIDLVTVDGNAAEIKTLKDGLAGPTGVALSGGKTSVTKGQLAHLFEAAENGRKTVHAHLSSMAGAALASLLLGLSPALGQDGAANAAATIPQCHGNAGGIVVPRGFCATVWPSPTRKRSDDQIAPKNSNSS